MAAVAAGWLDLDGSTSTTATTLLLRRWWWPPLPPSGAAEALRAAWDVARAAAVAPVLAAASWACLALSAMLLADAVFLAAASLLAPRGRYRAAGPAAAAEENGDEEASGRAVGGGGGYPMVLIQIPMYNEREVRAHLIYSLLGVYKYSYAMRWIYTVFVRIIRSVSFLFGRARDAGVQAFHWSSVQAGMAVR